MSNATLTSNKSEGVCIEGENSVALTDCTLTVTNSQTNGNATFLDSIMIYQSQSGDAADGTSSFSMSGGEIISNSGHVFHVTNTTAVINLNNVTINNADSNNVLLSVCDDGWSGASNIATLNADSQTLTGDILVGDNSTFTLNIIDNSTFTGNILGEITNASGGTVSTAVGTVNVTIDDSSQWILTGDTYISSFNGTTDNLVANGFTLYVDNEPFNGDIALDVNNTVNNTLISGTTENDTIQNSGENVTINAGDGNDNISNITDAIAGTQAVNALIDAGAGNDSIINSYAYGSTIYGGEGNDTIYNVGGYDLFIDGGAGNNSISLDAETSNVTIQSGGGNDTIYGYVSDTKIVGDFTASTVDGADLILTNDTATVTVVDATDTAVTIVDSEGNESVIGGEDTLAPAIAEYALKIIGSDTKYPAMALDYFHPTEENPDDPTLAASSETMTITSADDLTLSGVHFTPENPNDRWVILVHGYGKDHRAMNGFVDSYLENGYNVLAIDQRAAGDSEGEYLTMGVAESNDVALWTQAIAQINSDAQITLHGVSMGAATVMLAAANSNTTNVTAVVEDCGYTDVREVFINLVANTLGVDETFVDVLYAVAEELTGYDLNNAAPINSIDNVTAPTLFINGDSDTVVPASMAQSLYDASGSTDKEILIVEGAAHAKSSNVDYEDYYSAVFSLANDGFIAVGESLTIDGVTYTAIDSYAQLIMSDSAVVGISYGTVNATIADSDTSLTITFDTTNGEFAFTAAADSLLSVNGVNYVSGDATLNADSIILSAGAAVSNAGDNSFTVFDSGVYAIDGQTFNLADDIDSGLTLTNTDSGFVSSRVISATEVDNEVIFDSDVGKVFTENVTVSGDDSYSINLGKRGIGELSEITSGATVSIAGVFDGESAYSLVDIVTDAEGEFTFGDSVYTITGDDSVDLKVRFDSDGTVAITNVTDLEGVIYGDNISAVMSDTGAVNINDKTFTLIESVESGVTITSGDNGFSVAHKITAAERADDPNGEDSDIGKNFVENVQIVGDEVYSVANDSAGINEISGISAGASITVGAEFDGAADDGGTWFNIKTDSEGEFTIGDTTYTITGDDSVELSVHFNNDGTAEITDVNDLQGYITGNGTVIGAYEINNSESGVVEGSKFNDTINNSGVNVTIDAGAGDDLINNTGDFAEINAGEGNDSVVNDSEFVTITGGDGDDSIENNSTNAVIDAGDGNNTINNTSELATIIAGSGDDLINNNISAENESADEGDNTSAEINAGDGANTINNNTENATITGGADDDIINNSGSYAVIDAGDGANSITNSGVDATITSGAGNDTIITDANSTINSGNGNDYISVSGAALINAGGGNSTIDGYSENVTIQAGTLRNSSLSGDNLVLRYNDAAITIIDGKNKAINLVDDEGNFTNDIIIGEVEVSDTGTVNGVEFSGNGTVSVNNGDITLSGDLAVDTDEDIVIAGESNITIGNKVFEVAGGTATVATTDDGVIVNGDEVTVSGDDEYTVLIENGSFTGLTDISARSTVIAAGEYGVITDERGTFTFGENTYTISGDDNVLFEVDNNSVKSVSALEGTVSGEFAGVGVNDNTVSVSGVVNVAADENSLTISGANSAEVTMTAAGDVNIGTRTFELTSDATVAVSINDSSVAVTNEAVTIAGDRVYTVQSAGDGIDSVIGVTGGATVTGVGEYNVLTDSQGNFTFDKAYSVAGDNSVEFAVNNGSVKAIDSLDAAATVSGEFAGVSVNGGVINVAGDSSVAVVNTSSGLDIRNVSSDATVKTADGAYRVTTDQAGAYNILGEKITVTGDNSVIFNIDSVVTGVSNIENATVAVDAGEVTLAVNGAETINYHSANNNGELVIGSSVNGVSGVDSVAGLNNATVHATSAVTVNGAAVNVSVDNNYDVVVASGDVVSVKNINANSTLAVNNVGVQSVEEGAYTFGDKTYTIVEDAEVNFAVNGNGVVENISGLTGGVAESEAFNASINGVGISVSDASATIYGSSRGISNIDGLGSNATVQSSAINNILIAMDNGTLTANDIVYELSNDNNGANITGRVITNLDSNASLKVDTAATYTVNGSVLNANVGDIIIGASDGSAYIYDPNNIRIDDNTTTEEIIEQLGVDGGYAYTETNASVAASVIASGNLDGNMSLNIGSAVQNEVDFSESSGRKLANITSGAHNVTFNDAGDNIAVVNSSVANAENIVLGEDGDIVVVEETSARVSIVGGAGDGANSITNSSVA